MYKLTIILVLVCLSFSAQAYQMATSSGLVDVGVANSEGVKASYRIQVADVVPVATATDVITLCGSATKIVRVVRIQASADSTAASVIDFYVFKRSAVNTGGTSAAVTSVPHDSKDSAATAIVLKYSANPTKPYSLSHAR